MPYPTGKVLLGAITLIKTEWLIYLYSLLAESSFYLTDTINASVWEKTIIYQSIGANSASTRDLEHTLDGPLVEVGLLIGPHPSYVTNKYFLKCAEIKNNGWYLMKWNEWEIISPLLDFWILYLIYILF